MSRGSTDLHLSSAITVSLLSVIMFPGRGNTHFSEKATGTLAQCMLTAIEDIQHLCPRKKENVTGIECKFLGGELPSLICSHYLPLCCYQNDRNDLGNLLDVWYRHSSVLKSILVEFKVLHGVWKTNCLKKTSILWCRLLTQQGTLLHAWSLNSFSDTII